MSNAPLSFDIEIENLALLNDAIVNAPDTVNQALEAAHEDALIILSQSIEAFTPIDTGFLISNGELRIEGGFQVAYSNFTPYASFVEASQQFVEQGVELARDDVEAVYEDAMDEVARTFGSGR